MKTIFKTYDYKQARAKQLELEARTGLKWSYASHGKGMVFCPVITSKTPTCPLPEATKLVPFIRGAFNATGFVKMSEESGFDLADVLIMAKTLTECTTLFSPTVNRMGKWNGIYKR